MGLTLEGSKADKMIRQAITGMNDGGSLPTDETGTRRFAAAITHLREAAMKAGVKRVVLCTPPPQDNETATPSAHDANLARYSAWLLSKRADGWDVVDIHGPMRKALDKGRAKDPHFAFAGDGVHPNRAGHWLMASAILTQFLGANLAGVSSAEGLFQTNGPAIRELAHKRMSTLFAAWMTQTGHTRPGVPGAPGSRPGPTIIPDANARAAEITRQIVEKMK